VVDADEIVVLSEGRVIERGDHARLLARGGLYRDMWMRQQDSSDNGALAVVRQPGAAEPMPSSMRPSM
jgi:ATP-binding cassette subfamily B protein